VRKEKIAAAHPFEYVEQKVGGGDPGGASGNSILYQQSANDELEEEKGNSHE